MNRARTAPGITFALIATALIVMALAGCASAPVSSDTTEYFPDGAVKVRTVTKTDTQAYYEAQGKANTPPPAQVAKVEVPGERGPIRIEIPLVGGQTAQPVVLAAPDTRSGFERGMDRLFTTVERIAPWGFGYGTLREAFKAASQPITVTASGDGAAAASGGTAAGSFSSPVTTNTSTPTNTTTTTTSTTNSHNGGAGAAGGSGGQGTTTGGAGAPGGSGGSGG